MLDALPRTSSGKLDRIAPPKQASRQTAASAYVACLVVGTRDRQPLGRRPRRAARRTAR